MKLKNENKKVMLDMNIIKPLLMQLLPTSCKKKQKNKIKYTMHQKLKIKNKCG